jgi:hypothetical protein
LRSAAEWRNAERFIKVKIFDKTNKFRKTAEPTRSAAAMLAGVPTSPAALLLLERENDLPIPLHVHDDPIMLVSYVKHLVEGAYVAIAFICILAIGICVVHEQSQLEPVTGLRGYQGRP